MRVEIVGQTSLRHGLVARARGRLFWLGLLLSLVSWSCGGEGELDSSSAADVTALDGLGDDAHASDASSGDGFVASDAGGVLDAGAAAPSGPPYAVGVTTLTTIGADGRALPTEVWYPIETGSQGKAAKYMGGLVPSPYGAIRDAPARKGPFPLFAFSHGNGGVREQSVFLMEAVARMGYVVVSPDHIGNTLTTMDDKLTSVMLLWRPKDLVAAIDRVIQPEKGDPDWLTGLVQPDKIAVSGHSFGGYTALAVAGIPVTVPDYYMPKCETPPKSKVCKELAKLGPPPWNFGDPRVKLCVPLAHALYAVGALDSMQIDKLKVPVVAMSALGDTIAPYKTEAQPLYDDIQGTAALIVLQGGSHFSFANMCEVEAFAPKDIKKQITEICKATAFPTMQESHAIVVEHTLAALSIWLKGDDSQRVVFDTSKDTKGRYTLQSKGIVSKR